MNTLLVQTEQPRGVDGWGLSSPVSPVETGISGDMYITIGNLSFSSIDVLLLTLCPLCAALGVLVSFVMKNKDKTVSGSGINRFFRSVSSYIGNLFIGLVLGLVIALFFVGAINNEVTSLSRVLALSVLFGYQSKYLWFSQEGVITKLIDKKVKEATEK